MKISSSQKTHIFFLIIGLTALIISLIHPYDSLTWVLEATPVIIGMIILVLTYKRFPLTTLTYLIILIFALIIITGAHYTYERMPLFNWIRDSFELKRNHFDRLGHLFQGMTPALIARELLIRTSPLKQGKWLFFVVICITLAISASYELIEWWSTIFLGDNADSFVGSQGDIWDAQWDMFLALCGAMLAQIFLGKRQDHEIKQL